MFVLQPLMFPSRGGTTLALSCGFADRISFLLPNLIEEARPRCKYLRPFISMG